MVQEVPLDVMLHVVDLLPHHAKSWHRSVCKAVAEYLRHYTMVDARAPDLPRWLLEVHYQHMLLTATSSKAAKQPLAGNLHQQQTRLLTSRAAAGDLAGVQWLRAQGCAWSSHACLAAAQGGHLAVLQWLLQQRPACPLDAGVCALAAAASGRLPVLQFLQAEALLRPFDLEACAEAAAAAGHGGVLEWLVLQDAALRGTAATTQASQAAAAAARQQVADIMRSVFARMPPAAVMMVRA